MANLTDFLPLLQKLPNPMISRSRQLHHDLVDTYGGMLTDLEDRMQRRESVPDCLAKTMITNKVAEDLDEKDMAILASAFMIGGVETTASIMQWFSALIPAYPEVQSSAQEELDRVVGRGRLPTVDDEKSLPYCRAIIKEVCSSAGAADVPTDEPRLSAATTLSGWALLTSPARTLSTRVVSFRKAQSWY
jgi:cytochrome P450